jgi:hypothetical protein
VQGTEGQKEEEGRMEGKQQDRRMEDESTMPGEE